jgi:hypothetical protein
VDVKIQSFEAGFAAQRVAVAEQGIAAEQHQRLHGIGTLREDSVVDFGCLGFGGHNTYSPAPPLTLLPRVPSCVHSDGEEYQRNNHQ